MLTREGFPFWEGYCRPLSHSSGYMLHVVQFCPRLQLPQVFPGHSASGQVHAGQFPAHPSSPEEQGEQLCLADRREEGSCSEQGEEGRCRCGAPLNPWCSSAAADSADLYMCYLTAMAVGWATWQVRTHLNYNQMTTFIQYTWIIQDDHSSYIWIQLKLVGFKLFQKYPQPCNLSLDQSAYFGHIFCIFSSSLEGEGKLSWTNTAHMQKRSISK